MGDKYLGPGAYACWWDPGGRNKQADSDTDSEHRRLREEREDEEATTSDEEEALRLRAEREEAAASFLADDDLESHITVEDVHEFKIESDDMDEIDSETAVNLASSDPIDPDATISDNEEQEYEDKPELSRNGITEMVTHYEKNFKDLKLDKGLNPRFFSYMQEFHGEDDVKAALMAGTDKGVKEVAAEFLERYGNKVWKLKGKNCMQDRKLYGKAMFDIKSDSDKLILILEELWFGVRDNLYFDPKLRVGSPPPIRRAKSKEIPKYPTSFTSPPPRNVRQTEQEQEDALQFLNKVRKETHGIATPVQPRPKEELWKH